MRVCTTCGAEYGDEKLFCERDGTPLRKSGSTDLVGEVIADRYHITKKLGEGGMGQVYLAEHVKMGRRCAIKIMTPGTMSDPDAISRFNREAANASRISHPNVCAIYDFGETPEGLIYLAMELIDGKSLTALLDETPTMPLTRAAAMIEQCAEALHVAHDLGIVHRDLKPDNIMVITARGKDTVKVVDFGIAKAMSGDEGGKQKVTKTGFVVGTPEYMSPEQLAGDNVDGRSDIYSLGLVFYRMLTGASPFPADSQQETMIKRLTDDPIPLAAARPDVRFPAELQRLMDRALARTPTDRYADAADFARDIRKLATTMTGHVDVEAGTQVVRADELKAAIPATRVDPQAGLPKGKPGAPPPTNAAATAPVKKGTPLVPIAATVVVLAVAGGVFLMKRGAADAPPDSRTTPDTNQVQIQTPIGNPGPVDTQKAVIPDAPKDTTTKLPTGSSVKPPVTRPVAGRDSAKANPLRPPADAVVLPPVDDIFDDGLRDGARAKAEAIYRRSDVSDSIRAMAADMVSAAYQQDSKLQDAITWGERASRLQPNNEKLKTHLAVLRQALGN
jgi:serine/threonine-protein kinase